MAAIFYCSATGTGDGFSAAWPTSLSNAQTLARAAGPGAVVYLLDTAGKFYLTSALTMTSADNGTTYRAYPGSTPVISGSKKIATSWTNVTGSKWTTTPGVSTCEQLMVNGVLGQRPIKPINPSTNTWVVTGTGFTAQSSDATILNAITGPASKIRVLLKAAFVFYIIPITGITGAGATLTAASTPFANLLSAANIPGSGFTIDHSFLFGYMGDPSFCSAAGDWGWDGTTLTYIARSGDVMGSSPLVEIGNIDTVLTVTGASTVMFIGITFEGAGDSAMAAAGYQFVGAGLTGSFNSFPTGVYDCKAASVQTGTSNAVRFSGSVFQHGASNGLWLQAGSTNCIVEGCTFNDFGGNGYLDGEGKYSASQNPASNLLVSGNIMRRSKVTNCGVRQDSIGASCCAVLGYTAGSRVVQSTFDGAGYIGVISQAAAVATPASIRDDWRFINCVVDHMAQNMEGTSTDGGAIHSSGPNATGAGTSGCVLRNVVVGRYVDNLSSKCTETNLVVDTRGGSTAFATLFQGNGGIQAINNTNTNMRTGAAAQIQGQGANGNVVTGWVASDTFDAPTLAIIAQAGV